MALKQLSLSADFNSTNGYVARNWIINLHTDFRGLKSCYSSVGGGGGWGCELSWPQTKIGGGGGSRPTETESPD